MKFLLAFLLCASLSAQVTLHPASTLRGQGRGHSGVGITGMSISPSSVVGTNSSTGTVTLNSTAGGTVSLSSSNSAVASVPATVTVPNGQTAAQFGITTTAVVSNTTVTITGNLSGMATANITVQAPTLQSISLNPSSVTGGSPSTGTATLTGPAPTGGETVTLSSSNTAVATVPASVLVPVGQQSANFTVSTTSGASTTATITGTLVTQQSAILTITGGGGAAADTLPGTNTVGWQQLANTSLTSLCPSTLSYFSTIQGNGCSFEISAWSTGVYDSKRRRLVLNGGGHIDYGGNELYAIQLDGSPAFSFRMNDPSPCTGCNSSSNHGSTDDDGSPRSTHHYGDAFYEPIQDLIMYAGLASTFFNSDSSSNFWAVAPTALLGAGHTTPSTGNPSTGWATLADMNPTVPFVAAAGRGSGALDSVNTGLYFFTDAFNSGLFAFNPSATSTLAGVSPHGIVQITGNGAGCQFCTSVVDPVEKRLYQFGGDPVNGAGQNYQYRDINPSGGSYGAINQVQPSGCPAVGSGPGATWDPVAQMLVIWPHSGEGGSDIWAYNPAGSTRTSYGGVSVPAGQCVNLTSALPISGTGPPDRLTNREGTYGKFQYVDYCDCFVVLNAYGQNAFIVRTRTHTTPNLFVSRTAGVNIAGGSSSLVMTSPLNGGDPMNSAVVQNCTNGGVYFGAPTPPAGSCNGAGWTLDSTTADADDAGITNGSWNSLLIAPNSASSGNIFHNFTPNCCGSANNNANPGFSLGQEFFVQYRLRYDANVLTDLNWSGCFNHCSNNALQSCSVNSDCGAGNTCISGNPSSCGFKQDIIREEDHFLNGQQITANACAGDSPSGIDNFNGADEIVLQQISPSAQFNHNHSFIYTHCPPVNNSEIQITNPQTGNVDQIDQGAAGCFHGPVTGPSCDGGWCAAEPPTGNCFDYHANDWMTVQIHVIIGAAWGQCCSKIEVWMAHDQQPSQLIISLSDWILGNDDPTNGKYGKLWTDLFNTGATGVVNNTNVWYDNVIVSKRRIPDPDVSVPNAPDNLTISNPGCSSTPCSVTVNWRVNSHNHTAQDDEGMVVERAQVASGVSDWVPFANQNNSNSGGSFAVVATLPPGTASYIDTGLTKGTTYVYRVRAKNTFGNSAYAASLCVRNGVQSSTPAQPWSPTPQNPCGGTVTP